MTGSYYFWKWADNDLPGPPLEVHAALLAGEMHPALQPFDARRLLKKLESAAAEARKNGEEWDWEVTPPGLPEQARFVFVTCPRLNESTKRVTRFGYEFVPLGLSGYDEREGHLIPCLPPKLNSFIIGQPREAVYDILVDDLPHLDPAHHSRLPGALGRTARPASWRGCHRHGTTLPGGMAREPH
jgi:hypothetical protein